MAKLGLASGYCELTLPTYVGTYITYISNYIKSNLLNLLITIMSCFSRFNNVYEEKLDADKLARIISSAAMEFVPFDNNCLNIVKSLYNCSYKCISYLKGSHYLWSTASDQWESKACNSWILRENPHRIEYMLDIDVIPT